MKRTILATSLALAATVAAFAGVEADYDRSYDFAKAKTYSWRPAEVVRKDGALQNSIVDQRIRDEVRRRLAERGLTEVDSNPDLYVGYNLTARDRRSVTYMNNGWGGWGGWGWHRRWGAGWGPGWGNGMSTRMETPYTEGTLVIDLLDGRTRDLVWRGVSTTSKSNVIKVQQKVDEQVEKILKKFPPKPKDEVS